MANLLSAFSKAEMLVLIRQGLRGIRANSHALAAKLEVSDVSANAITQVVQDTGRLIRGLNWAIGNVSFEAYTQDALNLPLLDLDAVLIPIRDAMIVVNDWINVNFPTSAANWLEERKIVDYELSTRIFTPVQVAALVPLLRDLRDTIPASA